MRLFRIPGRIGRYRIFYFRCRCGLGRRGKGEEREKKGKKEKRWCKEEGGGRGEG
jgi:hypothetical protein